MAQFQCAYISRLNMILVVQDFSNLWPPNTSQLLQLLLNRRNNDFCSNTGRKTGWGMGVSLQWDAQIRPCVLFFIDYLRDLQGNFDCTHFLPCVLTWEFNCLTCAVVMTARSAGLLCAWSFGWGVFQIDDIPVLASCLVNHRWSDRCRKLHQCLLF